jgi:hypothetical protein
MHGVKTLLMDSRSICLRFLDPFGRDVAEAITSVGARDGKSLTAVSQTRNPSPATGTLCGVSVCVEVHSTRFVEFAHACVAALFSGLGCLTPKARITTTVFVKRTTKFKQTAMNTDKARSFLIQSRMDGTSWKSHLSSIVMRIDTYCRNQSKVLSAHVEGGCFALIDEPHEHARYTTKLLNPVQRDGVTEALGSRYGRRLGRLTQGLGQLLAQLLNDGLDEHGFVFTW